MSAYDDRKKSLEAQYLAQQQARQVEKQRQEQVYEDQLQTLTQEREKANREAYIRQQQQLTALPEELSAYGINGGGAETSLLKIHADYNNARDQIRSDYNASAGEVRQGQRDLESAYAAGLAKDRADYYDRLAQLAAEIAEAQAAEQARKEEMELAWAKLAQEKQLAQEKLTASQTKTSVGSSKNTGAETENGKSDTKLKQIKMPSASGMQTLTDLNGVWYSNPIRYDGTGKYYVMVDGQPMTEEQIRTALLNQEIEVIRNDSGIQTYRRKYPQQTGAETAANLRDRLMKLKNLRG